MKKLKLFGLFAILSAFAYGATNPGESTLGVTTSQSASAGVPFEVRVNIIPAGPELCLVDENGTLIDNLRFDHGTKLQGVLAKSQVEKTVVLRRTDGKAFSADKAGENADGGKNYKVTFEAKSPSFDKTNHKLVLTKLNSATGNGKYPTMDTTFNYRDEEITVNGEDTNVRTLVTSVIPAGTNADDGLYVATGEFTATLIEK